MPENDNQRPVYADLPPEQQQALSDEVKATLQFMVDSDMKEQGELSDGTIEAITVQGYAYRDGGLAKLDAAAPGPAEPITAATYYAINETSARRAKEAISFSDYRAGSQTAEYRQSVDNAVEIAKRQKARVDPMYHDKIDRLLDTYARKLAANMNHGNEITARVPSVMIAGPANFPVRQKEKQNAASHKNVEEWRYIQGLLDKIRSTGMGGISADDPAAVQKLQDKLAGLEKAQETMKAANAYYRKHKTLDGCPALTPVQVEKIKAGMARDWRANPVPFASFSLSNNNAEIRRVKARIAELTRRETAVYAGWQFDGGEVRANVPENRLQVLFDEKPDADKRAELRSNGFRWAPSAGAWQRQLNNNAFWAADNVKCIQPLTGETPRELQQRARREAAAAPAQPEPERASLAGRLKDAKQEAAKHEPATPGKKAPQHGIE